MPTKPRYLLLVAASALVTATATPQTEAPTLAETDTAHYVSLREAVSTALLQNRLLQIERLNPDIARFTLMSSYSYYEPTLTSQIDRETASETGGFDPLDFGNEPVSYSAESEVGSLGLTGFLPSGMSYNIGSRYVHSEGTRNLQVFDSYKVNAEISVRQPLLRNFWTDAGRTAIKVNKKALKISELGVAFVAMDTINQVQQAYHELVYATEDLKVKLRLLKAKEDTLEGVRQQVKAGTLTVLEEQLAVSQAAAVRSTLILSSNVVFIAENALKTLMGYTATNWAATTGRIIPTDKLMILPTVLDVNQSWGEGYNRRPDLAQMRQNLERADLNMRFRRNQLFPSLDFIAGYGRRGADAIQYDPLLASDPLIQNDPLFRRKASLTTAVEQLDNATAPNDFIGVVFAVPLSFTAERANYRAGKKLKEQAELMIKQREELVLREVSDAFNWATTAYDRIQATTRTREYAQAALRAEEQKLARGTSSLFFVLQLQSDVAAAETAEIRARADYNKALSQLHFAEGTLLDRVHMDLEVQ